MKKTIPKIGLILIAKIVFPTLFFSAYEVNNLSKNEQVVDFIYSSQLASIVFSLNQYSDDVLGRWANAIDVPAIENPNAHDSVLTHFIKQNPAIKMVFFARDSLINKWYSSEGVNDSLVRRQMAINPVLISCRKLIEEIPT